MLPGLWDAHVHLTRVALALRRLDLASSDGPVIAESALRGERPDDDADGAELDPWVRRAARAASARGVVGIVDMEHADNGQVWRRRAADGFDDLRVRASVWPEWLDRTVAAGLHDGDRLDQRGLVVQGPLKLIADGSIRAATAWCHSPHGPRRDTGTGHLDLGELTGLLAQAARAGIGCAVHATGDAAIDAALSAFSATHAHGSIEHAELVTPDQAAGMARLGLTASVQPQHLLTDRDACDSYWPGRTVSPLATLRLAGVDLALGSDAPLTPLNPWATIQAAVRCDPARRRHPEELLSLSEAIRASTSGVCRLVPGAPADLILVDENPFDVEIERLHTFGAAATVLAGRVAHSRIGPLRGGVG